MRKLRFLLIGLLFTAGISTAIKINLSYGLENELSIVNIEALATGESTSGGCYGSGSVVCDSGLYYGKYY